MDEKYFYDAAVAEVRGSATEEQLVALESDVEVWIDALYRVVEEVDSQIDYRTDLANDSIDVALDDEEIAEIKAELLAWKKSIRVFKKHVQARLYTVSRRSDYAYHLKDDIVSCIDSAIVYLTEEDNVDYAVELLESLLKRLGA
jgi:hypothetical protein